MTTEHSDVAADLWTLAETVLTHLEPVLRQAMDEQRERPRQGCSWCPVCALAALVRGEQHDLLTLLATEGAAVLVLVRQLVAEHTGSGKPSTEADRQNYDDTTVHDRDVEGHQSDSVPGYDSEESVIQQPGFVPITVTVKGSPSADTE